MPCTWLLTKLQQNNNNKYKERRRKKKTNWNSHTLFQFNAFLPIYMPQQIMCICIWFFFFFHCEWMPRGLFWLNCTVTFILHKFCIQQQKWRWRQWLRRGFVKCAFIYIIFANKYNLMSVANRAQAQQPFAKIFRFAFLSSFFPMLFFMHILYLLLP